MNYHIKCS